MQPQRDIGVFGGIGGRGHQIDLVKAFLRLAGPGHGLETDRAVAKPKLG